MENHRILKQLLALNALLLMLPAYSLASRKAPCTGRFAALAGYRLPAQADEFTSFGVASKNEIPRTFNAVLWNAEKGMAENWAPTMASLLREADVLLMQEIALSPGARDAMSSGATHDWRMATSFRDKRDVQNGVATGAVAKPIAANALRSPVVEPIFHTPKMSLLSKFPVEGGQTLLTVNIHAINFVGMADFRRHMKDIFMAVESHRGPILLAGDMNTWRPARTSYLRKLAERIGLKVGSSRVDLQACKLEYSIVSPK